MAFVAISDTLLKLVKKGKIQRHVSVSKGKTYSRGKLYLKGHEDIGLAYRLYKIENLHLVGANKQHRKGKAYLIFMHN